MALIKCPECGHEISNMAISCPYCGCPSSMFFKDVDIENDFIPEDEEDASVNSEIGYNDENNQIISDESVEIKSPNESAVKRTSKPTNVLNGVILDYSSSQPEDYIEVLNVFSRKVNGLANLGVFAEIQSVSHSKVLTCHAQNEFLSVNTKQVEMPNKTYRKDNSSTNVNDYTLGQLVFEKEDTRSGDLTLPEGKMSLGLRTRAILSTLTNTACTPGERCSDCSGNGNCRSCRGEGETRCLSCGGKGEHRCPECGGRGETRCSSCGGKKTCFWCSGRGGSYDSSGSRSNCLRCHGSGLCQTCNGSGNEKCWKCRSQGFLSCSICGGSGYETCDDCDGTGRCETCTGSGTVVCRRCNGSGWFQSFDVLQTEIMCKTWSYSGTSELTKLLHDATGTVLLDGTYKEWKKKGIVSFDYSSTLHDRVLEKFDGDEKLVDELFDAFFSQNLFFEADVPEVPYRFSLRVDEIDVVTIEYSVDGKKYHLTIAGNELLFKYDSVPREIQLYKKKGIQSLKSRMTYYARAKAYCYLASYVFKGKVKDGKNKELIMAFVDSLYRSKRKKARFLEKLALFGSTKHIRGGMDNDTKRKIKILIGDNKTLLFAYHCMLLDHYLSDEEKQIIRSLSDNIEVSTSDHSKIKSQASRLAYLDYKSVVTEYLDTTWWEGSLGTFKHKFKSFLYQNFLLVLLLSALSALSGYFFVIKPFLNGEPFAVETLSDMDEGLPVEDSSGIYEYVDLGLSVKWATCNVGASKPEDCGDYFAWGETEPKTKYNIYTYKYGKESFSLDVMTKYCNKSKYGYMGLIDDKIVLDLEDDAAHVNWGGNWRMPTKQECDELRKKCTWTWTTLNGVNGYKVQSKKRGFSDKWIFLPATGKIGGTILDYVDSSGYYWSSTLHTGRPKNPQIACYLYIHPGLVDTHHSDRCCGCPVRPVLDMGISEQTISSDTSKKRANGLEKSEKIIGPSMKMVVRNNGSVEGRFVSEGSNYYIADTQEDFRVEKSECHIEIWSAYKGQGVVYLKNFGPHPCYSEPRIDSDVVANLWYDEGYCPETYECLGYSDGWIKIRIKEKEAFVQERFVEYDGIDTF